MRISDWSSDVCSSDLDRLNQLPLGLIGIGLGTILLPTVSRLLSSGRESEAMVTQNRGIELALFLTLPATAAFIAAAGPIVSGLFERGHFDAADTLVTSWALAAFSSGLPPYVLVQEIGRASCRERVCPSGYIS